MTTFDDVMATYRGSDGDATRALYARLEQFAPRGTVAVNLLRAAKASERAKVYRGGERGRGSYRGMAYGKKDWALGELCRALTAGPDVVPSWGWAADPATIGFEQVLYIDLPGAGQVSFHTSYRKDGPDYAGRWDGVRHAAARRICLWAAAVLDGREVSTSEGGDDHGVPAGTEGAAADSVAEGEGREVRAEGRQEALDL